MNLIDHPAKAYGDDPEEMTGRYITNSMGLPVVVTLKRSQWRYLDWLEARGANIPEFILCCDRKVRNGSLSGSLQWWVYKLYLSREREGLPRPDWLEAFHEE